MELPDVTGFEESERRRKSRFVQKNKSLGLWNKLEQSIHSRKINQLSTNPNTQKIMQTTGITGKDSPDVNSIPI